jgi:hypothetical protein
MTAVTGKRRGRGEDSIYWDDAKSCYVGAVSLGYSPSGTRIRKRVMARTKTEVREKLRELHQQAENGVRPRRHYTVNDALDDWLETGLDGLAPATVTVYRNTITKALREELGTVELTKLTAGAVQKALADLAVRVSTRTVQMAHNVLVRAIRHAERDDLVRRNVGAAKHLDADLGAGQFLQQQRGRRGADRQQGGEHVGHAVGGGDAECVQGHHGHREWSFPGLRPGPAAAGLE